MTLAERRYAVESKQDAERLRIDFMVDNMATNKAYLHARARAGGDRDGRLLEAHRQRYRDYRIAWRSNPRRAVEDRLTGEAYRASGMTPLCVDIEVAAVCDLACPFCFRQHIVTPDKAISEALFYRIIDQCAELGVPSLKLNWRGEPLLHPKLPRFVEYAKRSGILEVMINTNAVTLDESKARALIDAGLDMMIYSFDGGSRETYEKMRVGRFTENRFDDVYQNIRRFSEVRQALGSVFPRTKIQMILTEDTFHEKDSFNELFEDCVDDVSVKAYTERGGRLPDLDDDTRAQIEPIVARNAIDHEAAYWRDLDGNLFVSTGRLPCEQPYQRLMVTYDGRVSPCCYDWGSEHPVGYVDDAGFSAGDADYEYVNDAIQSKRRGFAEFMSGARMPSRDVQPPKQSSTLKEIWFGEEIDDIRAKHGCGEMESVALCTRCPFKETYEWVKVDAKDLS